MDAILLGRGNVAQALMRLLSTNSFSWSDRFRITGIASRRGGIRDASISFTKTKAIPPVVSAANEPASTSVGSVIGSTPEEITRWIQQHTSGLVIDTTSLDSNEPLSTLPYLRAALAARKHVITANKGPVAFRYFELQQEARQAGVQFLFKTTVMDGTPVLDFPHQMLPGCRLLNFRGILNSTTNVILDRVSSGAGLEESLNYCRSIGVAEADPSHDLEGKDGALKIAICAQHFWRQPVDFDRIDRVSLTDKLPPALPAKRWRIVCYGYPGGGRMELQAVGPEDLMYSIEGTSNVLEFETDLMGSIAIVEAHPGLTEAAYGIVYDLEKLFKKEEDHGHVS